MRILLWHLHGSWTTAFVQGPHTYLLPTLPERGPWGRGRAKTWQWPESAIEVSPEEAARADVDVVIVQRPEELEVLVETWLGGRRPGRDLPCIYVEHNAPQGIINDLRHPAADRRDVHLVHVTSFNDLFWDAGSTPRSVIAHGIVDPGERYTGAVPRAAVVVNEPIRRRRVTGTDLLPVLQAHVGVDVFGMGVTPLGGQGDVRTFEDLAQAEMHEALADRRVYVHPFRWTSLGLSLIEAMHLGMPVVALATTEVPVTVPPECGVVTTSAEELARAARALVDDPGQARQMGAAARRHALAKHGLQRFLADWDRLLLEVTR